MRKLLVTVFMALIVSLSITPSFAARVRAERNTYFIEDAEGYATI